MRRVRISDTAVRAIEEHARAAYPDECCGFLVARGSEPPLGPRTVLSAEPARNGFEGEQRRRFEIRPAELRGVEARLTRSSSFVAGFYHSHPDHPARPSAVDQENAWPWYSYLVVRVNARTVGSLAAFELDPDSRRFDPVPLTRFAALPEPTGTQTPKSLLDESRAR